MNDADFWEALRKAGVPADKATALVQSHRSLSDADLWEQLKASGVKPDAATELVKVRGVGAAPSPAPTPAKATPGEQFINSILQGVTLNYGDELMGLLGGDAVRDRVREIDAQTKNEHPIADAATKTVAGAIPFLLGGGEAKGAGLLYNAARGAGIGATTGAIAGSGEGTDAASRSQGALVGGGLGAALGAAIPAGAALAKQTFGPANAAFQELVAAANKSGGVQKLRGALSNIVSAGRGDEAVFADLSKKLATKADFAANNSEDAFDSFVSKLGSRKKGQSDRLQQDVVELLGHEPDAEKASAALVDNRQHWADMAYSALPLDEEIPKNTIKDAVGAAFKQKAVKSAIKQARLAGDLDPNSPAGALVGQLDPLQAIQHFPPVQRAIQAGIDPAAIVAAAQQGSFGPEAAAAASATVRAGKRPLTWDDLHQLKQVFRDRADAAFTKGGSKGALGRAYATLGDAVEGVLHDNVPGYESVTAGYRQLRNLERAVVSGGKMWDKVDSRGLARELAGMSDKEKDVYRIGLASRMLGKLQNVQTNRNEAGAYANASKNLQNKLRVIFGDEATFQEYMRRANVENDFNKLESVVGNSATYRRAAAGGHDPLGLALDLTRSTLRGGHVYGAVTAAQRAAYGVNKRRIANELAPLLLTEGENSISKLLDRIEGYNPALGKFTSTVAPSVAGRLPGLFGFSPNR